MRDFIIILALLVVVIAISILLRRARDRKGHPLFQVRRVESNPIMSPNERGWSSQGVFNPAAVKGRDGRIHILYRALGDDGISRLGYSSSADGESIDDSVPYPIFILEKPRYIETRLAQTYDRVLNPSGGGWSGSEDPRMVAIDGRIYVTFNAFDGWDFVRVCVTSIAQDDFEKKRFKWSEPLLLSPKGEVHKNWVLFPQKFAGKFAILHSLTPEIQIDYVTRLEDISNGSHPIKSRHGHKGMRKEWDTWVRSAGPAPLKTDLGWLVLYHAVNREHPSQYRLGAMLLDLKNPKKVIARAPSPLLVPDMWYENDWKPGIIYACGAVIKDGNLVVYYGGGDKHVCVAKAPLNKLLDWLVTHGKVS